MKNLQLAVKELYCGLSLLMCIVLGACSGGNASTFNVTDLKCENLTQPVAVDQALPHFSWINTSTQSDEVQTAYEIEIATTLSLLKKGEADVWKSGKVMSAESVMVPYGGEPLQARRQFVWRVRTWNRAGECSDWSAPSRFGTGILSPEDFRADYIMSAGESDFTPILYKEVEIDRLGEHAVMYVNSLGYHELYINGQKVSDQVLAPAVSQLDCRSQVVAYDVLPYLQKGRNHLVLWLGKGWYKEITFRAAHNGPVVRAELDLCVNGEWKTVAKTDAGWKYNVSQVGAYVDLGEWSPLEFGGELLDIAKKLPALDGKTLSQSDWAPVKTVEVEGVHPIQQIFPGNRMMAGLSPVTMEVLDNGRLLLDFGRNVTGWFRAEFADVLRGDSVKIDYSDDREDDGQVPHQGEHDIFVSGGGKGEVFCNKFHHHAFRYATVSGLKNASHLVKAEALPITANEPDVATFQSSDKDINAIHDMIQHTLSCLAFSGYMVDCPHYERQGYGGDGNASAMTLQTMRNAVTTYYNWTQAWHDLQDEDGSMPHVAPTGRSDGGGPYWCGFIIQAPWLSYVNYGDDRMMHRHYSSMKLWLEYVKKYSPDGLLGRWPETYNRVWYLGDWLAPDGIDVQDERSVSLVSNCFVTECLQKMTRIARHLNQESDAQVYDQWRNRLLKQLHETYYHSEDSTYASASPLDLAYALNAGVVPEELREGVTQKLVQLSRTRYNSHIAVGLVGVTIFTEWAIRNQAVDLMFDILKQPDYPGYLYMINHGATTTWESWNRSRSHIHNCYNGIGFWFYQALAGIRPDAEAPGYRHFFIEPQIPSGLEWVKATKSTPYGEIAVSWKRQADEVTLQVTIPVGTTATVRLGDKVQTLGSGHHEVTAKCGINKV